jgi:hypothetical protein
MRKIADAIIPTAAAVAVITTLSALPAAASDARAPAVAGNERIDPSPASSAKARVWPRKSKARHVRQIAATPERVASLNPPGCGWFGSSCGRNFVLILGVGF